MELKKCSRCCTTTTYIAQSQSPNEMTRECKKKNKHSHRWCPFKVRYMVNILWTTIVRHSFDLVSIIVHVCIQTRWDCVANTNQLKWLIFVWLCRAVQYNCIDVPLLPLSSMKSAVKRINIVKSKIVISILNGF